jgi:hypothetical protein
MTTTTTIQRLLRHPDPAQVKARRERERRLLWCILCGNSVRLHWVYRGSGGGKGRTELHRPMLEKLQDALAAAKVKAKAS